MNSAEIRMRLGWVQLYEETQNAGYVCRRCGSPGLHSENGIVVIKKMG